jgi:hypothetical protein
MQTLHAQVATLEGIVAQLTGQLTAMDILGPNRRQLIYDTTQYIAPEARTPTGAEAIARVRRMAERIEGAVRKPRPVPKRQAPRPIRRIGQDQSAAREPSARAG